MTTTDRNLTGSRGPGRPYPSEADLMRSCQLRATELGARLWRNNSAQGWVGRVRSIAAGGTSVILDNARPLHAGLSVGSSDLIGLLPVLITPDHVGQTFGRFLSPEIKSRTGRLTEAQRAWLGTVTRLGGLAGVVRSIDDLEELLR